MRQARKSRHHIFTFVVLAAMAACAAIAPAVAAGDAGGDEYTLNVPGEGNNPVDDSNGGGDRSNASSDVSPATATDTTETTTTDTDETTGGAGGGAGGGGGNGGEKGDDSGGASGGSGSADKPRADLIGSESVAPTSSSSESDDGGVPVFLIAIAVLAAVCVGLAVWRMRRSDRDKGDAATREIDPRAHSL
jgi:cobalamin biosynthesis Mg chelatase CobN